jgi:energy-coupling factor transport system permease protein
MIRAFLFNLDERVKVWMAAVVGCAAVYCVDLRLQIVILSASLALCLICGARRFVAGFLAVALLTSLASALLTRLTPAGDWASMRTMLFILVKFGPLFAMVVFVEATLDTNRFLHSLVSMHAPPRWVIPLGVCLRFLPSVAEELRQVRYAMRIRGVAMTPGRMLRRPFETIGYMMAPLLVRSLTIGDELSRAAVARGIEAPGKKTSIHHIAFRTGDRAMFTGWTVAMAGMMVMDHVLFTAPGGGV